MVWIIKQDRTRAWHGRMVACGNLMMHLALCIAMEWAWFSITLLLSFSIIVSVLKTEKTNLFSFLLVTVVINKNYQCIKRIVFSLLRLFRFITFWVLNCIFISTPIYCCSVWMERIHRKQSNSSSQIRAAINNCNLVMSKFVLMTVICSRYNLHFLIFDVYLL